MEILISKLRVLRTAARSIAGKKSLNHGGLAAYSVTCRCKCGNSSWASVSCNVAALAGGHVGDSSTVISILARKKDIST